MSRELKKCRIYYDNTGVKAYDKMMTERYKNRKNPDNILPEGITDAEFRNAVIDIFCGAGWYVVYSCSQAQVNEEALENIIETITNKSATERSAEVESMNDIANKIIKDNLDKIKEIYQLELQIEALKAEAIKQAYDWARKEERK